MPENKIETIIISPHFDDEIIGNFEILSNEIFKPVIIYMQQDEKRKEEALKLKNHFNNIKVQIFQKNIPSIFLNPSNLMYFPDPIYEIHPEHRKWGAIGEDLFRKGFNIVFYTTNMNAPYMHEVKNFNDKKDLLDKIYPSQKDLWKYDHKYFLFEGRYRFLP